MYKILLVEDDLTIASTLKAHIQTWGYEAENIQDFHNVLSEFVSFNSQLVLLDIALPIYNGYHWCAEVRKISKVPIVFISSASDNMSIVMAMFQGGDDFISKPFDLNVLMAKIQAILRRTYEFAGQTNLLEHNGAVLDTSAATISYRGTKTELTKNEFRILWLLFENRGRVVTREAIMTKLWDTSNFIDDNTLTVNVTRLRNKLSSVGIDFIATKKGIGYYLE